MSSPSAAPLPTGPFLVTRQGGAGLTADQARSQRFIVPSRGVRIPRDLADDPTARREAALLAAPEQAVLTDTDAAAWWDLPLPAWVALGTAKRPVAVAVAVPASGNRPQRSGVRGRRVRLPEDHVTEHLGQRVTTPARTWLDCAPLIPVEHLIAMGDAALRNGLSTPAELAGVAHWAAGRRGVRYARLALPLLDPGSESPGESLARAHLVLAGIPRPQCNLNVVVDGRWIARVDLAWPDARVIVEYDGIVHLENQQRLRDAERRNALHASGWRVITFTSADLTRPWLMAHMVAEALAQSPSHAER